MLHHLIDIEVDENLIREYMLIWVWVGLCLMLTVMLAVPEALNPSSVLAYVSPVVVGLLWESLR